ncbi:hypothetical protein RND81_08G056900 [Saponaria officinalis]|uniref:Uncharacterized protein n=1 Tax=Saponaria officinalis TaxID=3572 RepID=A0AAW1J3Y7_SAPOF
MFGTNGGDLGNSIRGAINGLGIVGAISSQGLGKLKTNGDDGDNAFSRSMSLGGLNGNNGQGIGNGLNSRSKGLGGALGCTFQGTSGGRSTKNGGGLCSDVAGAIGFPKTGSPNTIGKIARPINGGSRLGSPIFGSGGKFGKNGGGLGNSISGAINGLEIAGAIASQGPGKPKLNGTVGDIFNGNGSGLDRKFGKNGGGLGNSISGAVNGLRITGAVTSQGSAKPKANGGVEDIFNGIGGGLGSKSLRGGKFPLEGSKNNNAFSRNIGLGGLNNNNGRGIGGGLNSGSKGLGDALRRSFHGISGGRSANKGDGLSSKVVGALGLASGGLGRSPSAGPFNLGKNIGRGIGGSEVAGALGLASGGLGGSPSAEPFNLGNNNGRGIGGIGENIGGGSLIFGSDRMFGKNSGGFGNSINGAVNGLGIAGAIASQGSAKPKANGGVGDIFNGIGGGLGSNSLRGGRFPLEGRKNNNAFCRNTGLGGLNGNNGQGIDGGLNSGSKGLRGALGRAFQGTSGGRSANNGGGLGSEVAGPLGLVSGGLGGNPSARPFNLGKNNGRGIGGIGESLGGGSPIFNSDRKFGKYGGGLGNSISCAVNGLGIAGVIASQGSGKPKSNGGVGDIFNGNGGGLGGLNGNNGQGIGGGLNSGFKGLGGSLGRAFQRTNGGRSANNRGGLGFEVAGALGLTSGGFDRKFGKNGGGVGNLIICAVNGFGIAGAIASQGLGKPKANGGVGDIFNCIGGGRGSNSLRGGRLALEGTKNNNAFSRNTGLGGLNGNNGQGIGGGLNSGSKGLRGALGRAFQGTSGGRSTNNGGGLGSEVAGPLGLVSGGLGGNPSARPFNLGKNNGRGIGGIGENLGGVSPLFGSDRKFGKNVGGLGNSISGAVNGLGVAGAIANQGLGKPKANGGVGEIFNVIGGGLGSKSLRGSGFPL